MIYEQSVQKLEKELEVLKVEIISKEDSEKRKEQGKKASRKIDLTEAETRLIIDKQMRDAGWEVDTTILKYSNGTRPQKGRNIAIEEWPTYSEEKGKGKVDYALFIGEKLVGFVEAKRYSKDVAGIMIESKTYAKGVLKEHKESYGVSNWESYDIPFLFITNGRKYIKEIESKSGLHFLDCRNSRNNSEVLQEWFSQQNIEEMLKEDIEKANKNLDDMTFEYLKSSNSIGLRYYQVDAIKAIEKSIKDVTKYLKKNGAKNIVIKNNLDDYK